ncbi:hypothetical protein ACLK2H_14230 [Escherichia coli]
MVCYLHHLACGAGSDCAYVGHLVVTANIVKKDLIREPGLASLDVC